RIAAWAAAVRAIASSAACGSLPRRQPRNNSGNATTATSSDKSITPDAMKIARSRPGSGAPPGNTSGKDNTPASVTAPRTPATVVTVTVRKPGTAFATPCFAAPRLANQRNSHTHTKRIAYSAAATAAM
ncbi:hypothetical protein KCU90_g8863, partial [Aureobasidium melanogenum]